MITFTTPQLSHEHSLHTLNAIREYDEFIESIGTVIDLGCGNGLDLAWWATLTTRDDNPKPLNIACTGVDLFQDNAWPGKYTNLVHHRVNFENSIPLANNNRTYDVLWCHDAFQYALNPLDTLKHWHSIASEGAMLLLTVPKTILVHHRQLAYFQPNGVYHHHTMLGLIHQLAISGWDCSGGFFKETPDDPCIHAIVYKSAQESVDPRTATWYDLAERNLLPDSGIKSVAQHGYLRQQDLVVPWLDHNLTWMGQL